MAWQAKPSGGYIYNSNEGLANIAEMDAIFSAEGFTKEAIAGICGNSYAESALNPWRWQSDTVNYSGGYGLFQFTPASGYIPGMSGVSGYAPNLSTSVQTAGADPGDGGAQCIVMAQDLLNKWVSSCWRSYWPIADYPDERILRANIINTWGSSGSLSLAQFKTIDDIESATFAFLACYEGPAELHLSARVHWAELIYPYLTGSADTDADLIYAMLLKKRKRKGIWLY